MSSDMYEKERMAGVKAINSIPEELFCLTLYLEGIECYDTDQLGELFEVESFLAPLVFVRRKSDGQRGTLCFRHSPRIYFDFSPVEED